MEQPTAKELVSQLEFAVELLVALRDGTFNDCDWAEVAELEEYVKEVEMCDTFSKT